MNTAFVLIFAALFFAVCAAAFLFTNSQYKNAEARKRFFDKLPRQKVAGCILSVAALIWCIPNLRPIFEPNSPIQNIILPGIVIGAVLICFFMDFLLARAFAAILILGAHTLLKLVYPLNPPGYTIFALLILSAGLVGMVIAAKPYWLRDWFRAAFRKPIVQWGSFAYFLALTVISIICAAGAAK